MLLALARIGLATNWTNFPIVISLTGNETFLVGTTTTNQQITALTLASWLGAHIPSSTNGLTFLQTSNLIVVVAGGMDTNVLESANDYTDTNALSTNVWSTFVGGAVYSNLNQYLPAQTYNNAWGVHNTNRLTGILYVTGGTADNLTNSSATVPANTNSVISAAQAAQLITSQAAFVSTPISLTNSAAISFSHGLSSTPAIVRWVIVCITNDLSYTVGDELPIRSEDDNPPLIGEAGGANSTNVFITEPAAWNTFQKGTATKALIALTKWNIKCYAIK